MTVDKLPYGDGSSKIFGMENFGNTCYCNSILQCLYYTDQFRTNLVSHNRTDHPAKLTVPGVKVHGFTAKYEQLVAKKLKDQGKSGSFVSAMTNGSGEEPPSSGSSNGYAGHTDNRPTTTGTISGGGSAGDKPAKRGSIFGIKFNYGNSVNAIGGGQSTSISNLGNRKTVMDAKDCDSLTVEQQLLIKKNPDFHNLSLLVTRNSGTQNSTEKMDYSQSLSMLLNKDNNNNNNNHNNNNNSSSNGNATSSSSILLNNSVSPGSIVVVGIPYPDALTNFIPNPSPDQRKRAALINGPIINLDSSLQLPSEQSENSSLLYALRDIFESMLENKSQIGVVSPNWFITKLKEKNYLFRQNNMHHDAHEFCNYLINEIIECLDHESLLRNWCNDIFKGLITNETKCLSCETITSKEESFLDLSIDIPPGESSYSLTYSLNNFSKLERLSHQNKFYCNTCLSLQEATKTIKIKKVPEVLVINFKRFKYDEKVDRLVKLFDSISYLHRLRLFNTKSSNKNHEENEDGEDDNEGKNGLDGHGGRKIGGDDDFNLFELYALVVHIGGGPMHGHYVALCKVKALLWLLFDDETVEIVDDSYVMRFFGDGPGLASAYILFYRKCTTNDTTDTDVIDFGFNMDDMYHGEDYLALEVIPEKKSSSSPLAEEVDLQHSHASNVENLHENDHISPLGPGQKLSAASSHADTLDTKNDTLKKGSLFKKNFKLDSFSEDASSTTSRASSIDKPIVKKSDKKSSWGLKRKDPKEKEAKGENGDGERRKSIFGFKRK